MAGTVQRLVAALRERDAPTSTGGGLETMSITVRKDSLPGSRLGDARDGRIIKDLCDWREDGSAEKTSPY